MIARADIEKAARPVPLPVLIENIPEELTTRPQWLLWKYVLSNGRWTKVPFAAHGGNGKSNDRSTWATFEAVIRRYRRGGFDGVGFAFDKGDGLTGLDLDHVIDRETGEISDPARKILERFSGAYIERSPGGEGLRIFVKGLPRRCGKNIGAQKWLEVYAHGSPRYLTVTGQLLEASA